MKRKMGHCVRGFLRPARRAKWELKGDKGKRVFGEYDEGGLGVGRGAGQEKGMRERPGQGRTRVLGRAAKDAVRAACESLPVLVVGCRRGQPWDPAAARQRGTARRRGVLRENEDWSGWDCSASACVGEMLAGANGCHGCIFVSLHNEDVLAVVMLSLVALVLWLDRKSTRLNSSHSGESRMPSSA